ncbi:hypothetical protein LF296_12775 [Acinetobacter vivianii]|uniref:Uncharacterized protein n=1 Tax=Acinetobacter vivianii TaxID=1776742 RepID=A0AAJ6NGV5_9GAMM|nr:hypothetical protein [Acinetobacter vivianii]WDZ50194.1 hypothetical protein LF296_12775 [Acinetobacter vivianii]
MQLKSVVCIGGFMDGQIVEDKGYKYSPLSRIDQRDYFSDLTPQEQMDLPMPKDEYEFISGGSGFNYYVLSGNIKLLNESLDQIKKAIQQ